MASPVLPSEFNDLIPDQNDSLCDKFKKFIDFIRAFVEWFSWYFNADGTISDEVITLLCAEDCISNGGGNTTAETTTSGDEFNTNQAFTCDAASQPFVVPAGVTQLFVQLWGGGAGGGGGGGQPSFACAALPYAGGGGGGGGSGGFRTATFAVTPGESLDLLVGCGGAGGFPGNSLLEFGCPLAGHAGSNGGLTNIARGPTVLAQAGGGLAGGGGQATSGGGTGGAGGTGSTAGNSGTNGTNVAGGAAGGAGGAGVDVWDNAGGGGGNGTVNSLVTSPAAGDTGNSGHAIVWWHS
jgi:hypothetical protein